MKSTTMLKTILFVSFVIVLDYLGVRIAETISKEGTKPIEKLHWIGKMQVQIVMLAGRF